MLFMPVVLNQGDFGLQGQLVNLQVIFHYNKREGKIQLASNGQRPGILLYILQSIGQPHNTELLSNPNVTDTIIEKPAPAEADVPPDNHTVNCLFPFQICSNATFFRRLIRTSTMTTPISPPMTLQSLSLCSPLPWFHSTEHLLTSNKTRLFITCIVYCQSARMFLFCSLIYPKHGV